MPRFMKRKMGILIQFHRLEHCKLLDKIREPCFLGLGYFGGLGGISVIFYVLEVFWSFLGYRVFW